MWGHTSEGSNIYRDPEAALYGASQRVGSRQAGRGGADTVKACRSAGAPVGAEQAVRDDEGAAADAALAILLLRTLVQHGEVRV